MRELMAFSGEVLELAELLYAKHVDRMGLESHRGDPSAFSGDDAVYVAAKLATRKMGFIEEDAECLACAWSRQVTRLGQAHALDWPVAPEDFGLRGPVSSDEGFLPCPQKLGLYVVAPSAEWVRRLIDVGVPTVQLRFKSPDEQAVRTEVRAAVEHARTSDSLLFINDHWPIAIEEGAYGVHLGQEDLAESDIHRIRMAGLRLGVSTHGYAEMLRVDAFSPSYVAMGAVFPTTLKAMPTPPQGPSRLHAYAQLMQAYPLVAIGGIDRSNLSLVHSRHVGSYAVVRAVVGQTDFKKASHVLIDEINRLAAKIGP